MAYWCMHSVTMQSHCRICNGDKIMKKISTGNMKKFITEKEEAVSPVIGVILMVAIVVILAAVIAAFIFGMTSGVQTSKSVGVTATLDGEDAVIMWQGGQDLIRINDWYVTLDGTTTDVVITPEPDEAPLVGTTNVVTGAAGTRMAIVATFEDGTNQVIFDRQF